MEWRGNNIHRPPSLAHSAQNQVNRLGVGVQETSIDFDRSNRISPDAQTNQLGRIPRVPILAHTLQRRPIGNGHFLGQTSFEQIRRHLDNRHVVIFRLGESEDGVDGVWRGSVGENPIRQIRKFDIAIHKHAHLGVVVKNTSETIAFQHKEVNFYPYMIKKIIWAQRAINRYVFKDTRYFFLSVIRYFQNNRRNQCKFYSEEELIGLIKNGKSIMRIGDGEIGLLHFCRAAYQIYSDSIRNDFLQIIKHYNDQSPYILGLTEFVNWTNTELKNFVNIEGKKINRFPVWRQLKITFEMIFNKNARYFDALSFYKKGGYERIILPYIKTKKVIIVTNKDNEEMIKSSPLTDKNYLYITCAEENSYQDRAKIQQDIIDLINRSGSPKKNFVVLFAGGLSKTIIPDMSARGYQILDIGWGMGDYYMGTSREHHI